jgi:hypothetical protein
MIGVPESEIADAESSDDLDDTQNELVDTQDELIDSQAETELAEKSDESETIKR